MGNPLDPTEHAIVTRISYALAFLRRPENSWIDCRVDAIARLEAATEPNALGRLESVGPALARKVQDGALADTTPLAEVMVMMALMRQIGGITQSVRWRNAHFFLQDGELVAERRPDTS